MATNRLRMAELILRYEDSKAGPDTLRVKKLPEADKGGDWEICGICDGIEPRVFHSIERMLAVGNREGAWKECCKYVLKNTESVRAWVFSKQGWQGVEFFLRDHYFNAGARSTAKILQRAINEHGGNLKVDGLFGGKSHVALGAVACSEGEFLASLYEKRDEFYRACKQFGVFGKGWLNRSEKCYRDALREFVDNKLL